MVGAPPQERLKESAQRCQAMREVYDRLLVMARDTQPVWLCGEAGSGRRTAAQALHGLSSEGARPFRLVHRSEIARLLLLRGSVSLEAQLSARDHMEKIYACARGGTLVLDEGGAPDLLFQGFVADLLARVQPFRVVLITEEWADAEAPLRELRTRLARRRLRLPPLRERRDEIVPLLQERLRGSAGTPAPDEGSRGLLWLSEEAAARLEHHPFHGNLRELEHIGAWLKKHHDDNEGPFSEPVISLRDLGDSLWGPVFDDPAPPPPSLPLLKELSLALYSVLRPVFPALPRGAQDDERELPWVPFLLSPAPPSGAEVSPHQRLHLGPSPLDEHRLAAALQARPLSGGARTGDVPVLGRLGPSWRGNLLALLRAAHEEMDDQQLPSLSLLCLSQCLLLMSARLSAGKLIRLLLRLPVELGEEELDALLQRLWKMLNLVPVSLPPCSNPQTGRTLLNAMRGLLAGSDTERLFAHAEECARCSAALLSLWQLPRPDLLSDQDAAMDAAGAPEAPADLAADYTVVDPDPPWAESEAAPSPPPRAPPLPDEPTPVRAEPALERETRRTAAPPASGEDTPTPAPSSASPVPTAPVTSSLRPLLSAVLFVMLMVLAATLGILYAHHGAGLWQRLLGK